jgi:hemoglobin/transferrin/lactoferrin receptor protein
MGLKNRTACSIVIRTISNESSNTEYMRIYFLFLICLLSSRIADAQIVTVTDKTNLQPISDVAIRCSNPAVSAMTNSNGQADIGLFKGADSLWFYRMGYSSKIFSFTRLSELNFIVTLSEHLYSLDEVVVSTSRFEEKRDGVAHQVQVMKSKEFVLLNQPTTGDVVQVSGAVLVQKSQLGGGSPIIRGFEANKILMVIDGVRMNNAIYRGGHLQNIITLDNSVLEKLEIVFGPGSVVYGSDALGGVLHFFTKDPLLSGEPGTIIKANAFTRYATASSEKTGHLDLNFGMTQFGSFTSVTISDFGDLVQGNNRNPFYGDWGKRTFYVERINNTDSVIVNNDVNLQKQSGYRQYDFMQKFLYKQNSYVSHTLNLQYSTSSDIPRYDRLTTISGIKPANAEWYYGPQKRLFSSYTLQLGNKNNFYDNARIIFGYQNIEESRHDRKFTKNIKSHRIENLDIITMNADFEKLSIPHKIRYGLEYTYNKVHSSANKEDIVLGTSALLDTRYPDGGSTMQSVAGYFTHSIEVNNQFIINDGIRISRVMLHSVFHNKTFFPFPFDDVTQDNTSINGNLGFVLKPGADWHWTLLGSTGFRAPNVDDLSKVFESVPGSVIVPNPNLKPEYTYNAEVGISKSFDHTITIGVTGFYTFYRNAITTRTGTFHGQDSILYSGQLSRVLMNVNALNAYIYGMNGFLSAEVTDNFFITGTINYTFGRINTDTTDYPLDHIPPVFGKTGFLLNLAKFSGECFFLYNWAKLPADYNLLGEDNHTYSADPVRGYMPGWLTVNVRTAYQIDEQVQIQLAVENIFDQNYRIFASNIGAPGRNIIVTLRGTF